MDTGSQGVSEKPGGIGDAIARFSIILVWSLMAVLGFIPFVVMFVFGWFAYVWQPWEIATVSVTMYGGPSYGSNTKRFGPAIVEIPRHPWRLGVRVGGRPCEVPVTEDVFSECMDEYKAGRIANVRVAYRLSRWGMKIQVAGIVLEG
ncbi:MAG: hypothetical protein RLZZ324_959 [Candidatus Parcubacteria bacterium]|jgi:hypothetical protein